MAAVMFPGLVSGASAEAATSLIQQTIHNQSVNGELGDCNFLSYRQCKRARLHAWKMSDMMYSYSELARVQPEM